MTHWLDRIIEEQAAYYGMTVEQYSRMTSRMAEIVEAFPEGGEPCHV